MNFRETSLLPSATVKLESLAPDLWLLSYPLKMLGMDLGRNVTIIRLASRKLVVHSTAPFSAADIAAIKALGTPAWLVDSLLRHDTFAAEGRAAFPDATYLAPPGFSEELPFETTPLDPPPAEWGDELEVLTIGGAPGFGEIAMFHRPSRTLIVADLVVHFPDATGFLKNALLTLACVGGRHAPGMTRPFKQAIDDPAAYQASIRRLLEWDFDRVIVGHGKPIDHGGKAQLRAAIHAAGFDEV